MERNNETTLLGLFPLRIVLFPTSSYPLHIFEERYKMLIGEAVQNHHEFGVNLISDGHVFAIGCRARVSKVITTYDDGKMDIVVTGTERFVARDYHADRKPYLCADVGNYSDDAPGADSALVVETIDLYNQLVDVVYGEAEELLVPTDWTNGDSSWKMAQKSGLDLLLRQKLLEMKSEKERLLFLRSYFRETLPRIQRIELLQNLVRNDGYVRTPDNPPGSHQ